MPNPDADPTLIEFDFDTSLTQKEEEVLDDFNMQMDILDINEERTPKFILYDTRKSDESKIKDWSKVEKVNVYCGITKVKHSYDFV